MKLLKTVKNSFKKFDTKIVLLLLAFVCLVVMIILFKKYGSYYEHFFVDPEKWYWKSTIKNDVANFGNNDGTTINVLTQGVWANGHIFKFADNKVTYDDKEISSISNTGNNTFLITYADSTTQDKTETFYFMRDGKGYTNLEKIGTDEILTQSILDRINRVICRSKYETLETVLKEQGFIYRPPA